MARDGVPNHIISTKLSVPSGTVAWWIHEDRRQHGQLPVHVADTCPVAEGPPNDSAVYSYVLGLYLGDGHIVSKKKQHHLSIYCCDGWPGLMNEAESSLKLLIPGRSTSRVRRTGCTEVKSYSRHWPCLLPQHGPGMKHTRPIVLEGWQQAIVDEYAGRFLRGLFHSDGCRTINRVRRKLTGGGERVYEYPRYMFSNRSADILGLCGQALDRLGIAWRLNNTYSLSVARSAAVAALDEFVGPKY